jgi:hypothetical protein
MLDNSDSRIAGETTPLVSVEASRRPKTPLPKFQICILMTLQVAEASALVSIFPYINQVFYNDTTLAVFSYCFALLSLLVNFLSLEVTLQL